MKQVYRIHEGSLQEQFDNLRSKVQVYGGGFANGKTSASCVLKALKWARDYPGSNGLMARSTYPKLNDTLRKEFLKWCPAQWIKSFPRSANGSNTCTLTNGSTINFRYIAQQSANDAEASTSNLLSATYDWIIVDQMEDPEIVEKDFDDLLGRLRGMTPYAGDDPTMPRSGPRYFVVTLNPTRNWVYKKLIKPLHDYNATGVVSHDLLCVRDEAAQPVLGADGKPQLLIGLVEGSTYENKENLTEDFIQTLESTYRGAMRERFLLGGWGSFEGLVYPSYDTLTHQLQYDEVMHYMTDLVSQHYDMSWIEGYDFGLAVPSCYILGFVDAWGNVIQFDGFYEKAEVMPLEDQLEAIRRIRKQYDVPSGQSIMADPAIFRRTSATRRTIGMSTADIFWNNGQGVRMVRGNNDIANGIVKVSSYLAPKRMHAHPITGAYGAPYLYHTDNLQWIADEYAAYMWKKNSKGDISDEPRDKNDHAMDTTKYMLSRRPEIAKLPDFAQPRVPAYMGWHEQEPAQQDPRKHRYG